VAREDSFSGDNERKACGLGELDVTRLYFQHLVDLAFLIWNRAVTRVYLLYSCSSVPSLLMQYISSVHH
jgi:hypothetical protein